MNYFTWGQPSGLGATSRSANPARALKFCPTHTPVKLAPVRILRATPPKGTPDADWLWGSSPIAGHTAAEEIKSFFESGETNGFSVAPAPMAYKWMYRK